MKISCIFKQAICLMSLLVLSCDSKPPLNRMCPTARILIEKENLLNKTKEFKKLFPDDITNMKLLTNALKKEFMENCSTRLHLLSFYANDVLSDTLVLSEAQKSGIREAFLKIEDLLKFKPCRPHECQLNKSTEETEGMKELRNKITQITLKEKLHKAISEIDTLILWINSLISEIKKVALKRQRASNLQSQE